MDMCVYSLNESMLHDKHTRSKQSSPCVFPPNTYLLYESQCPCPRNFFVCSGASSLRTITFKVTLLADSASACGVGRAVNRLIGRSNNTVGRNDINHSSVAMTMIKPITPIEIELRLYSNN